MPTPETQDTISPTELARLTGFTYATVAYHVARGNVEAFRDAKGLWRIPMPAARAFMRRPRYSRNYA